MEMQGSTGGRVSGSEKSRRREGTGGMRIHEWPRLEGRMMSSRKWRLEAFSLLRIGRGKGVPTREK
jgi:hypothetical protein